MLAPVPKINGIQIRKLSLLLTLTLIGINNVYQDTFDSKLILNHIDKSYSSDMYEHLYR